MLVQGRFDIPRRMKNRLFLIAFLFLLTSLSCVSQGPASRDVSQAPSRESLQTTGHLYESLAKWSQDSNCCTAKGSKFAVVSGGKNASKAALDVLKKGGNAIDAAVAAGLVLCVERPQSTGIGGGGFMTLRWQGKNYFIDFRESAPASASKDMFLDAKGDVIPKASQRGGKAVAVPSMIAGFWDMHKKFGKMKWKDLVQPAIDVAGKDGLELLPTLADRIKTNREEIAKDPYLASILLMPDGSAPVAGYKIFQKDLAATLERVANEGPKPFYSGDIAKKIVEHINAHGGKYTVKDLSNYKVKWRQPVTMKYGDFTVVTAPPPSAGGVLIGQMLGMLSTEPLSEQANRPIEYIHLLTEAMKRGYADRSEYAGDPDFVKVPIEKLLSPKYTAKLHSTIDKNHATPSEKIRPLAHFANDNGTSGFSIVDDKGNALSATITINTAFGAMMGVPGTGILLNNEMDDFSVKPGQANAYGLTGADANAIAPGKRPVSSMTPTILLKNGKPVATATGAGGSRIISGVFQVLLHYMVVKPGDIRAAVFAPRLHHQWVPDQLDLEDKWATAEQKADLEKLGHKVTAPAWQPIVHASGLADDGTWTAVYDPRDIGGVAAE